jgi:hypothetical protein
VVGSLARLQLALRPQPVVSTYGVWPLIALGWRHDARFEHERSRPGAMMSFRRLPAGALAACALGLILCPFAFIAGGALSDFSAVFSLVLLPPFLLSCGFLLQRFLARPEESVARQPLLWSLEAISWLVLVTFLYLVSGAKLLRGFERLGAVCTAFLAASAAALPLLLLRPTRLAMRMARLSQPLSILVLLLILAVSTFAMVFYLITPPTFIGQPGSGMSSGVRQTPAMNVDQKRVWRSGPQTRPTVGHFGIGPRRPRPRRAGACIRGR